MNKSDLISNVFQNIDSLNKSDIDLGVNEILEIISSSLEERGRVEVRGFGTFSVANRKATTGRNPRTGEVIQIKASKSPKFKAGKALKDAVN